MTPVPPDDPLIEYLVGKLSGDAADEARRYWNATPGRRGVAAAIRRVMRAQVLEQGPPDARRSLQDVLARLSKEDQALACRAEGAGDVTRRYARWSRGTLRTNLTSARVTSAIMARVLLTGAAIIALVVGVQVRQRSPAARHSAYMLTYSTANGERATITLPDGGTVMLNVASRLDVPMDYMTGNRTVRLVGEGLFTVTQRKRTPFTVLAGGVATHVLGTSFVVRHYPTDTGTTVAVRDGKVSVGETVVPAARQLIVGRRGAGRLQAADRSVFGFATGVLKLNGAPFREAIVELDRWYDADIRLGDPALADRHVAGDYAAGSLADLGDILAETFDVRVVRHGRVLTLYPR